jgi:hypothetical protein
LADRQFYILKTDDIKKSDLIDPMTDRNWSTINDVDSFKGFIEHLTENLLGDEYVAPLDEVPPFVEQVDVFLTEMECYLNGL